MQSNDTSVYKQANIVGTSHLATKESTGHSCPGGITEVYNVNLLVAPPTSPIPEFDRKKKSISYKLGNMHGNIYIEGVGP
jgi:hypothetical protein